MRRFLRVCRWTARAQIVLQDYLANHCAQHSGLLCFCLEPGCVLLRRCPVFYFAYCCLTCLICFLLCFDKSCNCYGFVVKCRQIGRRSFAVEKFIRCCWFYGLRKYKTQIKEDAGIVAILQN